MRPPRPASGPLAATGCAGLDAILSGGLTPNRLYLIEGVPGSGKTTLALQFLLEGARLGEPVLYVTLSETEDELQSVAESHGWSLDGVTIRELAPSEGSLRPDEQYTMFHPSEVELSETTRTILDDVERLKPDARRLRFALGAAAAGRQPAALPPPDPGPQAFLRRPPVHGPAPRRHDQRRSRPPGAEHRARRGSAGTAVIPSTAAERRRLIVLKYRGRTLPRRVSRLRHSPRRARRLSAPGRRRASPGRGPARNCASGHRRDGRRCSAAESSAAPARCIVGAAGTGKSTLGCPVRRRRRRARPARGDVHVRRKRSTPCSPGPTASASTSGNTSKRGTSPSSRSTPRSCRRASSLHNIRQAVDERGASIVVIDSLNGYLNAMPEERFLIIQLHELLTYLGQAGVATILIGAQHGLIGSADGGTGRRELPGRRGDPDALLRSQGRGPPGDLGGQEARRRARADDPGVPAARRSRSSWATPLRDFRGVLTGVPVLEERRGVGVRAARDRDQARGRGGSRAGAGSHREGRGAHPSRCWSRPASRRWAAPTWTSSATGSSAEPLRCSWSRRRSTPTGSTASTTGSQDQPPWSDLPVLVLARPGADSAVGRPGHGPARQRHRAGAAGPGRGAGERGAHGAPRAGAAVPDRGLT